MIMNSAIVLNGNDVIKVTNLKRKRDKIISNPNMKILEECDINDLDEKYEHWKSLFITKEEREEKEVKYTFINKNNGHTLVSIYDNLDNLKGVLEDWQNYERAV